MSQGMIIWWILAAMWMGWLGVMLKTISGTPGGVTRGEVICLSIVFAATVGFLFALFKHITGGGT